MTEFDLIKPGKAVPRYLDKWRMDQRGSPAALQAPLKEPKKDNSCKDYDSEMGNKPKKGKEGLITGLLHIGSCEKAAGAVAL